MTKKEKNLFSDAKTSWQEFFSAELSDYFRVRRVAWATEGQEALKKREAPLKKNVFQSSVTLRTRCHRCISEKDFYINEGIYFTVSWRPSHDVGAEVGDRDLPEHPEAAVHF